MGVKELPRLTVCTLFEMRKPPTNYGKEDMEKWEVGLNLRRLKDLNTGVIRNKHVEIAFKYRRKSDGELSLPDHYYFDADKLDQIDFEVQMWKSTPLVKIPFKELEILRRV